LRPPTIFIFLLEVVNYFIVSYGSENVIICVSRNIILFCSIQ